MKLISTTLTGLLIYWLNFSAAYAGEVLSYHVDYIDNEYHLDISMLINASPKKVWHLLTNYKNLSQLSHAIHKSDVIKTDNKTTRIKVISKGCLLVFCRTLTQVQDASELIIGKQNKRYLMINEVEGQSDFKSGYTLWQIVPKKNMTHVAISARLNPDFWIPPLLGPWLFQKKLVEQTTQLIINLETLAQNELEPQ